MRNCIFLLFFIVAALFSKLNASAQSGIITTVCGIGTGSFGGDGGVATLAEIHYPAGVTIDINGNMYIVDHENHRIRKVTPSGIITSIAGNGIAGYGGDGGPATDASLNYPTGLVLDTIGNIYIADRDNQRIRMINTSGVMTTFAGNGTGGYSGDGGIATAAEIYRPDGIAIDSSGNIYIADSYTNRVRKITAAGIISKHAGNGVSGNSGDGGAATDASFEIVSGVATDRFGNVYLTDGTANVVRKISTSGIIKTIAGTGIGGFSGDGGAATAAQLNQVRGCAVNALGEVFIADRANYCVRKIDTSGIISTVAGVGGNAGDSGDGGSATSAHLNAPNGLTLDMYGNVYISDGDINNRIRKIQYTPEGIHSHLSTPALTLFPNPATNEITIKTSTNAYSSYTITNLIGQQIITGTITASDTKLNIATFQPGVYFTTFNGENGEVVRRFVKM